jgi:hypothetical protein
MAHQGAAVRWSLAMVFRLQLLYHAHTNDLSLMPARAREEAHAALYYNFGFMVLLMFV